VYKFVFHPLPFGRKEKTEPVSLSQIAEESLWPKWIKKDDSSLSRKRLGDDSSHSPEAKIAKHIDSELGNKTDR
jgi:hypothetical protein